MPHRLYHPVPSLLPALLLGLLALEGAPAAVARQAAPGLDRETELREIRDRIEVLEARLSELDRTRDGLAGTHDRTALELELQDRRLAEARAERALAEAELGESERRVAALRARLEGSREFLRRRLVELYRIGRHGPPRLLLSIGPGDRLLDGVRILRFLTRREALAIRSYRAREVELERERGELVRRRWRVADLLAREATRHAELRAAERSQRRRLDALNRDRGRLAGEAEALLDRERKLASLLDLIYGRTPGNPAGAPIQEFRGVLDWPLDGRVTTGFGPRLDPRYRTRVPHNGLRLEPLPGATARVVFAGEVVFAAPFEGHGLTVVVHHAQRVFTVYAGLEALQVEVGDVLILGQPLGPAGKSLYFEIRVENQPRDPLDWLR